MVSIISLVIHGLRGKILCLRPSAYYLSRTTDVSLVEIYPLICRPVFYKLF